MRFEPQHRNLTRAWPPGLKRQLFVLLLLLAVVGLLSYRLFLELRRLDSSRAPSPSPPGGVATRPLAVGGLVSVDPLPPEPFVPNPVALTAFASYDRSSELHDDGIAYFFQQLLSQDDDLASADAVLDLQRGPVFSELISHPDGYRGRLVEVSGIIVQDEARTSPLNLRGIEFPNPSGRDRAFQSYLYGADDKYYVVATLEPQPAIRHRDRVRLLAYFAHLYTGDVIVDGELRQATVPFLVGRAYHVLETAPGTSGSLTVYLPILILLPMVALVFVQVLHRRAERNYERRRQEGRQGRRRDGQ